MMQTEYNGARGPVQALWIAFVREVGRENCIGEFDVFPPAYCNRAAFIVRHSVFFCLGEFSGRRLPDVYFA